MGKTHLTMKTTTVDGTTADVPITGTTTTTATMAATIARVLTTAMNASNRAISKEIPVNETIDTTAISNIEVIINTHIDEIYFPYAAKSKNLGTSFFWTESGSLR